MNKPQTVTPRVIIQLIIFILVVPLLPLLISQRWDWWQAWLYAAINIVGFAASRALAARAHPDLLAERARFLEHEDTASWDKILAPLVGLGGGLIPLVAGLDARFGWSVGYSLPVELAALLLIIAGFAFGSYALIENRYFSGTVRIQAERNHQVVSTGPYAWVRHPGYAGALLTYLATPIFLAANWAFVPVLFISAVLVVRTAREDQMLQTQLPGYREYAQRVRYRLLPGVW
ncbi:MAG: isoprenylcysteine carboxylmethyltransferase family protein [Chloroflexota bacterium]